VHSRHLTEPRKIKMDFTVKIYRQLIDQLIDSGYTFQTFSEFLESPEEKVIMLRHDVDDKKLNSLHFAEIQHAAGVKGSYYFRMVPQSFDEDVIRKIAGLGHEIGYHYEDMDLVSSKFGVERSKLKEEDLYDKALLSFKENLQRLRKLYPVKTICMHGSPRSQFDNKAVWKKYNYRDFEIIGEPYFDIDFSKIFYITDTGRRWDGDKVSVRDKVDRTKFQVQHTKSYDSGRQPATSSQHPVTSDQHPVTSDQHPVTSDQHPATSNRDLRFHSSNDLIKAAKNNNLPDKIMFTFHPQRWTDKLVPWLKELIFQNIKNQIKRYYIK
jgi:hypothetical protein